MSMNYRGESTVFAPCLPIEPKGDIPEVFCSFPWSLSEVGSGKWLYTEAGCSCISETGKSLGPLSAPEWSDGGFGQEECF